MRRSFGLLPLAAQGGTGVRSALSSQEDAAAAGTSSGTPSGTPVWTRRQDAEGEVRARALADRLEDAGIDEIGITPFARSLDLRAG